MKNIKFISIFLFLLSHCLTAQNFSKIDQLFINGIENKLFPGAVYLLGNKTNIIYERAYGRFTYEPNAKEVTINSMFDLASVTKVFATTMCLMKLYDEGKVNLEEKLSKYFPGYEFGEKNEVRVVDLLIHESGLPAYYSPQKGEKRNEIIDTVINKKLVYEKNTKTVYSCLNFVTTMLLIEKIAGKSMMEFYNDNFVIPLKLKRTMFNPPDELKEECLPTENGLQGIVHDPLARGLEGKSGNAGLFSTAEDLSVLCRVLLNDGKFDEKQIFKKETIELFTKRYSERSSRALGFDTKSSYGYTSAGKLFSDNSFGHTGYTGTSVWIDPVRKIYSIILTNRVYPDDKVDLKPFRPVVNDAAVEILEE